MTAPFNPLDMENLAHSIVTRILETQPTPLGEVQPFQGAGLYALYYSGAFQAYLELSAREDAVPIYIGKAVPSGGRRGLEVLSHTHTRALFLRIREHANSVRSAQNLDVADFAVRWLVVEDIWIPLGESALIRRYRPIWNAVVDGFGNHDPGAGRRQGMRSRWDIVHPGRSWAVQFQPRPEAASDIEQEIREYLRSRL